MNITLQDLSCFLEIGRQKNLTKAALALKISQPALSQMVKKLERSMNTQLMIRKKTGIELTRTGYQFSVLARKLTLEWESLSEKTIFTENKVSGKYLMGCNAAHAIPYLAPTLHTLLDKFPDLELEIEHDLSTVFLEKVITFQMDYAIVVNPNSHPDLVIRKICSDPIQFWTGAKKNSKTDPHSGEGILLLYKYFQDEKTIMQALQNSNYKFKRTIVSSSLEIIAAMTAYNAGISILPKRLTQPYSKEKIKALNPDLKIMNDDIFLIYRYDTQTSEASRLLSRALQDLLIKNIII